MTESNSVMKQRTTIKTQAIQTGREIMNDSFFIRKSIISLPCLPDRQATEQVGDVKINKQISTLQKSPIRKSMKKINDHSSNSLIPIDNSLFTFHLPKLSFIKNFLHKTGIFSIALTILFTAASMIANASNRYSVANGNWNATSTWSATSGGASGASAPVAADVVFIEGSHTVTMTAAAACTSLSIASGSALNTQNFQLTGNAAGTFTMASGANMQLGIVDCSTANAFFPSNFTTANIILDPASSITYAGGTGSIAVSLVPSYGNLSFQGCATKTTGTGTLTVRGSMSNGTVVNFGSTTVVLLGDFTIGQIMTSTSGTFYIGGNFNIVTSTSNPFTANGGTVVFNGTGSQTIGGYSATFNNVQINKPSGTAILSANESVAGNLTISAGTLDISSFTINRTAAGGTLTISNGAALRIGGAANFPANYGTNTIGASSTVEYYLTGAQSVSAKAYGNLILSGSGAKSVVTSTSVAGNLSITGATASIGTGLNISVGSLTMGGLNKINGTWGSTTATTATYHDNTYFAATTGYVTVTTDTRPTPSFSGLTASQSICFGTATVALSGTVSAAGPIYPANGETVGVTINGSTQNATIAGGAGGFSINFPTAAIPVSGTPYTITYAYAGNVNLTPPTNNTSTALTVNANVTPTFAAVAPICPGASLSALPATSTNGITGSWSPALNNTTTTTYTFTPTAGQCATTASLTITVNANPTTSIISQSNITCFSTSTGTIVVTGSGGSGTYSFFSINNGTSYQASNTFNNLPAGVYQIRVKDSNGCESKSVQ